MVNENLSLMAHEIFLKDYDERNMLYEFFQSVNRNLFEERKWKHLKSLDDWAYHSKEIAGIVADKGYDTSWCEETAKLLAARAWADGFYYFNDETDFVIEAVKTAKARSI